MAYIGKTPTQAVRNRYHFTATGGETSITSTEISNFAFEDGALVDVMLNGLTLIGDGNDYNTTTANTIGGLSALAANDVIEIVVYEPFSVFSGNVNGDFNINGNLKLSDTAITATAAELNYVDGVTSNIQTQIDNISTDVVSDTSPSLGGDLSTNGNDINFGDNDKAQFGASNDLSIYHDGSNSYIIDGGTGDLIINTNGNAISLNPNAGGEYGARVINNGAVELYHDNTKKFETTSYGGDFAGVVNTQAGATYGNLMMPVLEITDSGTPTQIKITTNIPFANFTNAETVNIKGFAYGRAETVDLTICWHVYNNSFYNRTASSGGGWSPKVQLGVENGKVVIHLTGTVYWPKLYVHSHYSTYGSSSNSTGWSWTNAAISGDTGKPVETVLYKQTTGSEGANVQIDLRQGSSKVWVNFDGTASGAASRDSYNVSSMADRGTGKFTVNINNNMNNDDYSPAMSGSLKDGAANDTNILVMGTDRDYANPLYTGYFYIHSTYRMAPTTTYHDGGNNYVQVVGDLA